MLLSVCVCVQRVRVRVRVRVSAMSGKFGLCHVLLGNVLSIVVRITYLAVPIVFLYIRCSWVVF